MKIRKKSSQHLIENASNASIRPIACGRKEISRTQFGRPVRSVQSIFRVGSLRRASHGLIARRASTTGKEDHPIPRASIIRGRAGPQGNNAAQARRSASSSNTINRKKDKRHDP